MTDGLLPFQRLQQTFAAAIRDPQNHEGPDAAPPQRLQIYRQLVYNNLESFLATGFPVVKAILSEAAWSALIRDFLRRRQCKTPYLFELAEEFLSYLQDERSRNEEDPPFLLELAHYEWVELALLTAEASPPEGNPALFQEPMSQTIYLSELAWPLAYRFPVHRIGRDYLPSSPPSDPTFLLVYRDRSDEVKFLEIGVGAYQLLSTLQHAGPIKATLAFSVAAPTNDLDGEALNRSHRELLTELVNLSVIGICAATDQDVASGSKTALDAPR